MKTINLGALFKGVLGQVCSAANQVEKKFMSSWNCAADCCLQHEETAWAGELCLPVQKNACLERSQLKMGYVCGVDLEVFAGPSELQCLESPQELLVRDCF